MKFFIRTSVLSLALYFVALAVTGKATFANGPIPIPAPGSATLLAPLAPNPVQYGFSPGTVISSGQVNSVNTKMYTDMAQITSALNGCLFVPGGAIGSVTATAPLSVSLSACQANAGTGSTLSIAIAGIIAAANGGTGLGAPGAAGNSLISTGSGWTSAAAFPEYDNTGAVMSGTHTVFGACPTASNQDCFVTLSGAAQFGSNTYACSFQYASANANEAFSFQMTSQTPTGFTIHNTTGPATYTRPYIYFCHGK